MYTFGESFVNCEHYIFSFFTNKNFADDYTLVYYTQYVRLYYNTRIKLQLQRFTAISELAQ